MVNHVAEILTIADAAEYLGIKSSTLRAYMTRGKPTCDPFPAPDGTNGVRGHWWLRETVEDWAARRDARLGRTT